MAGFCAGCGAGLTDGVKFCPGCGKPTDAAAPATQAASSGSPAPPSSVPTSAPSSGGGGGILKIILIILGIFALIITLAMGACFYAAYRVKQKASEFSKEINQEMKGNTKPYTGSKEPCSFVTEAEVAEAMGQPVKSSTPHGDSCEYVLGANGEQQMPVRFSWQGGALAMKLTHGAMKSISAGMDTFTSIAGVGDEAYIGPGGAKFMMRKGDVMVNIDLGQAELNAGGAQKVAALIAQRM